MSKSLDRFRRELRRISRFFNQINWINPAFTAEKAYVNAIFSKIAYLEIPDFEVRHQSLAKIVPCLTYLELIARGTRHVVREFLGAVEFENMFNDVFVVTTKHVIAVGVATQKVIIVALRGTRGLYLSDWMIDLHVPRTTVYVGPHEVNFHSGFYLAITDCLLEIVDEVQKRTKNYSPTIPVYVVGHSLGGAMAAITFALDSLPFYSKHRFGRQITASLNVHSSFSYGMPRYGDEPAMRWLKSPFHTYNDKDVVPGLPPCWAGYQNAPIEYRADKKGSLQQLTQDNQGILWWLSRAHLVRGVRHHKIERYIRHLGVTVNAY